jgi:hypothetical protein
MRVLALLIIVIQIMYYNGTEPEVREDMLGIRTI